MGCFHSKLCPQGQYGDKLAGNLTCQEANGIRPSAYGLSISPDDSRNGKSLLPTVRLFGSSTTGDVSASSLLCSRLIVARGHVLAAVFEGHASPAAAKFCRSNCWDAFIQAVANAQLCPAVATLKLLDRAFLTSSQLSLESRLTSGCSATLLHIDLTACTATTATVGVHGAVLLGSGPRNPQATSPSVALATTVRRRGWRRRAAYHAPVGTEDGANSGSGRRRRRGSCGGISSGAGAARPRGGRIGSQGGGKLPLLAGAGRCGGISRVLTLEAAYAEPGRGPSGQVELTQSALLAAIEPSSATTSAAGPSARDATGSSYGAGTPVISAAAAAAAAALPPSLPIPPQPPGPAQPQSPAGRFAVLSRLHRGCDVRTTSRKLQPGDDCLVVLAGAGAGATAGGRMGALTRTGSSGAGGGSAGPGGAEAVSSGGGVGGPRRFIGGCGGGSSTGQHVLPVAAAAAAGVLGGPAGAVSAADAVMLAAEVAAVGAAEGRKAPVNKCAQARAAAAAAAGSFDVLYDSWEPSAEQLCAAVALGREAPTPAGGAGGPSAAAAAASPQLPGASSDQAPAPTGDSSARAVAALAVAAALRLRGHGAGTSQRLSGGHLIPGCHSVAASSIVICLDWDSALAGGTDATPPDATATTAAAVLVGPARGRVCPDPPPCRSPASRRWDLVLAYCRFLVARRRRILAAWHALAAQAAAPPPPRPALPEFGPARGPHRAAAAAAGVAPGAQPWPASQPYGLPWPGPYGSAALSSLPATHSTSLPVGASAGLGSPAGSTEAVLGALGPGLPSLPPGHAVIAGRTASFTSRPPVMMEFVEELPMPADGSERGAARGLSVSGPVAAAGGRGQGPPGVRGGARGPLEQVPGSWAAAGGGRGGASPPRLASAARAGAGASSGSARGGGSPAVMAAVAAEMLAGSPPTAAAAMLDEAHSVSASEASYDISGLVVAPMGSTEDDEAMGEPLMGELEGGRGPAAMAPARGGSRAMATVTTAAVAVAVGSPAPARRVVASEAPSGGGSPSAASASPGTPSFGFLARAIAATGALRRNGHSSPDLKGEGAAGAGLRPGGGRGVLVEDATDAAAAAAAKEEAVAFARSSAGYPSSHRPQHSGDFSAAAASGTAAGLPPGSVPTSSSGAAMDWSLVMTSVNSAPRNSHSAGHTPLPSAARHCPPPPPHVKGRGDHPGSPGALGAGLDAAVGGYLAGAYPVRRGGALQQRPGAPAPRVPVAAVPPSGSQQRGPAGSGGGVAGRGVGGAAGAAVAHPPPHPGSELVPPGGAGGSRGGSASGVAPDLLPFLTAGVVMGARGSSEDAGSDIGPSPAPTPGPRPQLAPPPRASRSPAAGEASEVGSLEGDGFSEDLPQLRIESTAELAALMAEIIITEDGEVVRTAGGIGGNSAAVPPPYNNRNHHLGGGVGGHKGRGPSRQGSRGWQPRLAIVREDARETNVSTSCSLVLLAEGLRFTTISEERGSSQGSSSGIGSSGANGDPTHMSGSDRGSTAHSRATNSGSSPNGSVEEAVAAFGSVVVAGAGAGGPAALAPGVGFPMAPAPPVPALRLPAGTRAAFTVLGSAAAATTAGPAGARLPSPMPPGPRRAVAVVDLSGVTGLTLAARAAVGRNAAVPELLQLRAEGPGLGELEAPAGDIGVAGAEAGAGAGASEVAAAATASGGGGVGCSFEQLGEQQSVWLSQTPPPNSLALPLPPTCSEAALRGVHVKGPPSGAKVSPRSIGAATADTAATLAAVLDDLSPSLDRERVAAEVAEQAEAAAATSAGTAVCLAQRGLDIQVLVQGDVGAGGAYQGTTASSQETPSLQSSPFHGARLTDADASASAAAPTHGPVAESRVRRPMGRNRSRSSTQLLTLAVDTVVSRDEGAEDEGQCGCSDAASAAAAAGCTPATVCSGLPGPARARSRKERPTLAVVGRSRSMLVARAQVAPLQLHLSTQQPLPAHVGFAAHASGGSVAIAGGAGSTGAGHYPTGRHSRHHRHSHSQHTRHLYGLVEATTVQLAGGLAARSSSSAACGGGLQTAGDATMYDRSTTLDRSWSAGSTSGPLCSLLHSTLSKSSINGLMSTAVPTPGCDSTQGSNNRLPNLTAMNPMSPSAAAAAAAAAAGVTAVAVSFTQQFGGGGSGSGPGSPAAGSTLAAGPTLRSLARNMSSLRRESSRGGVATPVAVAAGSPGPRDVAPRAVADCGAQGLTASSAVPGGRSSGLREASAAAAAVAEGPEPGSGGRRRFAAAEYTVQAPRGVAPPASSAAAPTALTSYDTPSQSHLSVMPGVFAWPSLQGQGAVSPPAESPPQATNGGGAAADGIMAPYDDVGGHNRSSNVSRSDASNAWNSTSAWTASTFTAHTHTNLLPNKITNDSNHRMGGLGITGGGSSFATSGLGLGMGMGMAGPGGCDTSCLIACNPAYSSVSGLLVTGDPGAAPGSNTQLLMQVGSAAPGGYAAGGGSGGGGSIGGGGGAGGSSVRLLSSAQQMGGGMFSMGYSTRGSAGPGNGVAVAAAAAGGACIRVWQSPGLFLPARDPHGLDLHSAGPYGGVAPGQLRQRQQSRTGTPTTPPGSTSGAHPHPGCMSPLRGRTLAARFTPACTSAAANNCTTPPLVAARTATAAGAATSVTAAPASAPPLRPHHPHPHPAGDTELPSEQVPGVAPPPAEPQQMRPEGLYQSMCTTANAYDGNDQAGLLHHETMLDSNYSNTLLYVRRSSSQTDAAHLSPLLLSNVSRSSMNPTGGTTAGVGRGPGGPEHTGVVRMPLDPPLLTEDALLD